jgi:hypothetical protein
MNGLEELIHIAHGLGIQIEQKPLSVLGRCDYQSKTIYLDSVQTTRKKMIILSHELGHWMSYCEHKQNTSLSRNAREKLAYEYGWYLIINLKIHERYKITKDEWFDINSQNFNNRDPDTREAWK